MIALSRKQDHVDGMQGDVVNVLAATTSETAIVAAREI